MTYLLVAICSSVFAILLVCILPDLVVGVKDKIIPPKDWNKESNIFLDYMEELGMGKYEALEALYKYDVKGLIKANKRLKKILKKTNKV